MCFAILSCKSDKTSVTETSIENPPTEKKSEEELSSIYAYYHTSPSNLTEREENKMIDYVLKRGLDIVRSPEGVYYQVLNQGKGSDIKWGDELTVDYKGYTIEGKVFDSSYKRGEPLTFKVGNMIDGWNRTLLKMKRGDEAIMIIPSRLAYGSKGLAGIIEPNSTLVFEIKILDKQ